MARGVAKHDGAVGARHRNRGCLRFRELRESLRLLGKDHYGTGRVLDTFGMVYAARDNFHALPNGTWHEFGAVAVTPGTGP